MVFRIALVLASISGLIGLAYVLISLFLVRSIENGVSHHIIDGAGVVRGGMFLFAAVALLILAFVTRSAG